ncbi:MAG TPA: hypothetical protein VGN72_12685 [Tepidisphaeraceae bacterium]|nr:hypothetical protein [Tepidisphaeraceae bacterium]
MHLAGIHRKARCRDGNSDRSTMTVPAEKEGGTGNNAELSKLGLSQYLGMLAKEGGLG